MTASTRRPPRTIEIAAATLRRDIGDRDLACIDETDVCVCDDDGSNDVMCYYSIDGEWHATAVSAAAVPERATPRDVFDLVMRAAIEPRTLH